MRSGKNIHIVHSEWRLSSYLNDPSCKYVIVYITADTDRRYSRLAEEIQHGIRIECHKSKKKFSLRLSLSCNNTTADGITDAIKANWSEFDWHASLPNIESIRHNSSSMPFNCLFMTNLDENALKVALTVIDKLFPFDFDTKEDIFNLCKQKPKTLFDYILDECLKKLQFNRSINLALYNEETLLKIADYLLDHDEETYALACYKKIKDDSKNYSDARYKMATIMLYKAFFDTRYSDLWLERNLKKALKYFIDSNHINMIKYVTYLIHGNATRSQAQTKPLNVKTIVKRLSLFKVKESAENSRAGDASTLQRKY